MTGCVRVDCRIVKENEEEDKEKKWQTVLCETVYSQTKRPQV